MCAREFLTVFFPNDAIRVEGRGGRGGGGLKPDALPTTSTEPNNGDSTVPI